LTLFTFTVDVPLISCLIHFCQINSAP
jgi:hypothetical protein